MIKNFLLLLIIPVFIAGCANTRKITYLNDLEKINGTDSVQKWQPLLIQPGDVLQVTVTTIDKDISTLLNPATPATSSLAAGSTEPGYQVGIDGYINLPVGGRVQVKDHTLPEIDRIITQALEKEIRNVYVATRLANFKVSVLGDVAHPGSFKVSSDRVSILDALSMAGDMNVTAVRNDVMVIRETNRVKNYASLNLNDSKIFSSPYYYLNNNDVIYVKPGKDKKFASSKTIQLLPAILGVLSFITTLIIVTK
ncbi:MAG TPA: polysaccharide biosynthesis/export family protein [Chitinophaga sp.]|uniref:polysaccharide biosynthesis/export family protein n=1 Tax=Chitinophaga sp. TaxID=1869181 RepID=UPI002C8F39CB|nr:polysaccharide biosynthesis/export family protein [Chitinophaga sp.]HVI44793.1 polysaccharide biosynthesis/export family protein [Chitinophaga sp.]